MIATAENIRTAAQRTETTAPHWLYRLAGAAALTAMFISLSDVLLGFGGSENVAASVRSAADWFAVFQAGPFAGLYPLGILNILYMTAMLPVYAALFAAHRRTHMIPSALVVVAFLLSASIYISTNAAIPLLVLSNKYALAGTEAQRAILAAAGEAILARGEDFTPGSFIPLFLGGAAALSVSLIMLRGGVFGKVNAWVGVAGFSFLSLFTVCATFFPALYDLAFYGFASIGGLLALTWFALTARRLFQLGVVRQGGAG